MSQTLYGVSTPPVLDDDSELKAGFRPSALAQPPRRPTTPPKTPATPRSSAETMEEKPRG